MSRHALMWILWPSFLMAGVASAFVFALIDPLDMVLFGYYPLDDRQTVYAAGFFLFWVMAAGSSALTMLLAPARSKGWALDAQSDHAQHSDNPAKPP